MSKNKNVNSALSHINKKKTTKTSNKPIVQEVREKKKVGRPSEKDPTVKYVKLSASIPEETKMQMKLALYSTFRDKHKTQDDLINSAILHYINEFRFKKS